MTRISLFLIRCSRTLFINQVSPSDGAKPAITTLSRWLAAQIEATAHGADTALVTALQYIGLARSGTGLTLHGISRCHPSILFAVDSSTTAEGVSSPTLGDLETELQARREILAVLAKQDRHGFHNPIYRLVCVAFSASSSATRALSFAVSLITGWSLPRRDRKHVLAW